MRARLIKIGNSRGVRIPKRLLDEAGLEDEVELRVRDGVIVIAPVRRPRAGWAAAAARQRERGDDRLLDPPAGSRFDGLERKW